MPKHKGQFEGMSDAQLDEAVPLFRAECLAEVASVCINNGIPFVFRDADDGSLAVDTDEMNAWLPRVTPWEHVEKLFALKFKRLEGLGHNTPGFQLKTEEGGVMVVQHDEEAVTLEVFSTLNDDI